MNIVVLSGSPRKGANTDIMVETFADVQGLDNKIAMAAFRMDAAEAAINLRATKVEVDDAVRRIAIAEIDIDALEQP